MVSITTRVNFFYKFYFFQNAICLEFVAPDFGPFCLEKAHACNKNHLTQRHCMGSIHRVDLLIFAYW